MGSPNFWQALAMGGTPVSGGVPYINSSLTVAIDALNLYWREDNDTLHVQTNGDRSLAGAVNWYGRSEAFRLNSEITLPYLGDLATAPGYSVKSHRGTVAEPLVNQTGDLLGKFNGIGYTGLTPQFQELASISFLATGTDVNDIGGRILFSTKNSGGILVDRAQILTNGFFTPITNNVGSLGSSNFGWGRLYLAYQNSVTVGAQTINTPVGKFVIAAGQTSVTITNSLMTPQSIVFCQPDQLDATGRVTSVVPNSGSFTVHCTAPTANMAIKFMILSTDLP